MISTWSPERVAIVSRMWLAGHTSGEIARRLGVSRSTIMGRVRRLGLTRNPSAPPTPVTPAPRRLKASTAPKEPKVHIPPADRLWSLDEKIRRGAFHKRATKGAALALRALLEERASA